jgi:hypothetical protein
MQTGWLAPTPDEDQAEAWRQTSSLAALMLTLLIVVVSLVVIRELQIYAIVQDCLLTNRPGCMVEADRLSVSHAFDQMLQFM